MQVKIYQLVKNDLRGRKKIRVGAKNRVGRVRGNTQFIFYALHVLLNTYYSRDLVEKNVSPHMGPGQQFLLADKPKEQEFGEDIVF